MLDGDAIAAPAPRKAAPVASTENAIDVTDLFAVMRPSTAGEVLSTCVFIVETVTAKAKGSLSELGEFGGES